MSEIFDKVYTRIKKHHELKKSGHLLSIPPLFPRLAKVYGGFIKGGYYAISANSAVGKTQFAKYLTVLSIYQKTYNTNIKPKIFYFALEESEVDFWTGMMSTWLYEKYGIVKSRQELLSVGEFELTDGEVQMMEEAKEFISRLSSMVTVIDHIYNPTGFVKLIKAYFDNPEIGTPIYEERDGNKYFVRYEYTDPDLWVFAVFDHISLIHTEKQEGRMLSIYETLDLFSKNYCMQIFCKRYRMCVVNIHQQTPTSEKMDFTYKGDLIEEKLEPTLDGLHLNKSLQQDYDIVMGLFNPYRFNLPSHRGYSIDILKNNYRSLKFLKDRHFGLEGSYIGLWFNGKANEFRELPSATQFNTGQARYEDWMDTTG